MGSRTLRKTEKRVSDKKRTEKKKGGVQKGIQFLKGTFNR